MPRLARLDTSGVLHHIIIRGIERRNIFKDNKDRDNFLERLSPLLSKTKTACYAWALMSNHAHFLFRTGEVSLSNLMRKLLTGYALSFNRRHKRHGHLFQNRFKSIVCQEDTYLKELVRYIHLNPIRARMVSNLMELNSYLYSGHSVLVGKRASKWQDVNYVLNYFGRTVREGRKRYFTYVARGVDQGHREELVGGGLIRSLGGWTEAKKLRTKGQARSKADERILGDTDFVEAILSACNEKYDRHCELKRQGYDLGKIAGKVSTVYGIEVKEIFSKSRRRNRVEARDLVCYWAVRELGMGLSELGRNLKMSASGVGYAVQRGEKIAQENKYRLTD